VNYLVDADWLIDAMVGRALAQETLELLSDQGVAVSIIAVAEVYEGAFNTADPQRTLSGMREFLGDFAILPVSDQVVERFAQIRAMLRQQGQMIPDMDLLIASTALATDLTLITRNLRHFTRIPAHRLYARR
jgi:predicted nucleic acid-binding protein